MFGNDMMSKLAEMKRIADESKERLDNIIVEGEAGGGLVSVSMNGNREVKSVKINTDIKIMENDDLEDLLCVAFQRVMDKVNDLNEKEVMSSTRNLFPGM
jgi:DNA-binding YbaB/EbfC family protein